jgi:arginyl-tRNA synthetase
MTGPATLAADVATALEAAGLPAREPAFERPRQRAHGAWSTNVALTLAGAVDRPPREIAQQIVDHLQVGGVVERVEVAGPGFINFHLSHAALEDVVRHAVTDGVAWGTSDVAGGRTANVEFVSANPTGPLHLGHGRWVAVGDAISSLLEATGWGVTREYYFNDAGSQMEKFGASVLAALEGDEPPPDGYVGSYISELAGELRDTRSTDVTEDAYGLMLRHIDATLKRLRVDFDVYFGERALHDEGRIEAVIARLREGGHVYEADDATWLRTTDFGDDKDRVLLRTGGQPTYFAADCAYLLDKIERGFDRVLYILGADHHGYVKRLLALEQALGHADRVEVLIGQLVTFLREGEPVRMSKRSGELVTLDDLVDEVGVDAARYTLLRQSMDTPIDFDLAEVVRNDRENPVYYVQYSHARIAGIIRTAGERGVDLPDIADAPLDLLTHESEEELIRRIGSYPEVVAFAAQERAPHRIARYAEELAEGFHKFYTECTVLSADEALTRARLALCQATRQTLVNALALLGVTAPDRM